MFPALAGAADQHVVARIDAIAGGSEGDRITAVTGRKDHDAAIESLLDTIDTCLKTTLATEQIDCQQPVLAEANAAGLVKGQGVEDAGADVVRATVAQGVLMVAVTLEHVLGAHGDDHA